MLAALLKFELAFHFKQLTFRLSAFLFFVLGLVSVKGGFGEGVFVNSPYTITTIIGLLSLFTVFVASIFCANVVLRDHNAKMEEVLFATALRKPLYLISRYTGLLVAVIIVLAMVLLGVFAGSIFAEIPRTGPFNISYFLQPFLLVGIPNILFSSSLVFCVTLLTRSARFAYAAGVLLYILYLSASILGNSPLIAGSAYKTGDAIMVAALTDPFGLAAFYGKTKGWTILQKNTELFPLEGYFLWNRLLWLTSAMILIAITAKWFKFRLLARSRRRITKSGGEDTSKPVNIPSVSVNTQDLAYGCRSFLRQFKLETSALLKHIPFMVMLALWIFIGAIELNDTLFKGPYGIHNYPRTGIIIEELRNMRVALLLLIFFAAELLGREHSANFHAIFYATPVRNVQVYLAKLSALWLLTCILITANIGVAITLQLVNGLVNIEPGWYFSLFYYAGVPYFLLATLIVFIQAVCRNKYLGMLTNMVVIFVVSYPANFGIEHYLLRFADVPQLQFSYFNGFGNLAYAFNWYMLYWLSICGILALLTIGLWNRMIHQRAGERVSDLVRSLVGNSKVLFVCILSFVATGGYIYFQTNIAGNYQNASERLQWRADYEKKYRKYGNMAQPVITAVDTKVDLFPGERRYDVKGSYLIKNASTETISKILVGVDRTVNDFLLNLAEAEISLDKSFNQQWIILKQPMQPGDSLALKFELAISRNAFVNFDPENSITDNGSYIELEKILPYFGYDPQTEIRDEQERKKAGLNMPATVIKGNRRVSKVAYQTVISTTEDHHVATVGKLQRSWTANGRRFFNYRAEEPINFMLALSDAAYKSKIEKYKGVAIEILYLEGEEANLGSIITAIKDVLDYGNTHFSKYPFDHFTYAAIPQYRGAATAYPGIVFAAEKLNFLGDYRDKSKVDQAYAIAAHETAHQWWANALVPDHGLGSSMVTESLAKYTEFLMVKKRFGSMYLRNFSKADNHLYFAIRTGDGKELPLVSTDGESFVHYQKGGLVFLTISHILGEEHLNNVLHSLIAQQRASKMTITAVQLYKAVNNITPGSYKPFLKELFTGVSWYDLKLGSNTIKKLPDGRFKVKVTVRAEQQGQSGRPSAPDILVDIAAFDVNERHWNDQTKPLETKRLHLTEKKTTVTLILTKMPKTIVLDPAAVLLDANLEDNVINIGG